MADAALTSPYHGNERVTSPAAVQAPMAQTIKYLRENLKLSLPGIQLALSMVYGTMSTMPATAKASCTLSTAPVETPTGAGRE